MDSCSCQYSLEGPKNQKTIYYNPATHQKPYWMLFTPALEITKLEASVVYQKNRGNVESLPIVQYTRRCFRSTLKFTMLLPADKRERP